MPRKSKYDQLVDAIGNRLQEMAPENCQTIEESVQNDQTLSNTFGMAPTTAEDYSICPTCNHPMYHGICYYCK